MKVEKPETKYNVGWSHGKETLANGRYDTEKGLLLVEFRKRDLSLNIEVNRQLLRPTHPRHRTRRESQTTLPGCTRIHNSKCMARRESITWLRRDFRNAMPANCRYCGGSSTQLRSIWREEVRGLQRWNAGEHCSG